MPLHLALELLEELPARLVVELLVGQQLEEPAEREDRRAQLVRGGGDELLARPVEPGELVLHVVERGRELAQLVVGVGADRVREVARGHLGRRALQALDAQRERARHQVAGDDRDHQRGARRRSGSGGGSGSRWPPRRPARRRTPRRRRPPCSRISGWAASAWRPTPVCTVAVCGRRVSSALSATALTSSKRTPPLACESSAAKPGRVAAHAPEHQHLGARARRGVARRGARAARRRCPCRAPRRRRWPSAPARVGLQRVELLLGQALLQARRHRQVHGADGARARSARRPRPGDCAATAGRGIAGYSSSRKR